MRRSDNLYIYLFAGYVYIGAYFALFERNYYSNARGVRVIYRRIELCARTWAIKVSRVIRIAQHWFDTVIKIARYLGVGASSDSSRAHRAQLIFLIVRRSRNTHVLDSNTCDKFIVYLALENHSHFHSYWNISLWLFFTYNYLIIII